MINHMIMIKIIEKCSPPPSPKKTKLFLKTPYIQLSGYPHVSIFLKYSLELVACDKNTRKMLCSLLIRLCDYVTIMMIK